MTSEGKRVLKDLYEIIDMNFKFLCLGFYFDVYAKENNMSNLVKQIHIHCGQDSRYILNENLLRREAETSLALRFTSTID